LRFCFPKFSLEYPDVELRYNRFDEEGNEIELLLNGSNDIIFTSKAIDRDDTVCVHFITDRVLLSVPDSHPLAKEENIFARSMESTTIIASSPNGSFYEKVKPFWDHCRPTIQIKVYEDQSVFNQMLRTTNSITISTRLASLYRDDGPDRTLVPLADPELSIDYFICYLAKNKKFIHPFLSWAERYINDFEKG
jgi:DNA-binding transcriptional LysR family regulator